MIVAAYPSDQGGVGHYRLLFPIAALNSPDVRLDVPLEALWRNTVAGERVIGCRRPDADLVIFQRPMKRELADVIPHLQAHGVAVVVECDDDHQSLDPSNPCFREFHPTLSPDRNWQHLARACAAADLVTVSTPALAERYGRHGRVAVLPNLVPARYLSIARPAGEAAGDATSSPLLGWTGTPATHRGDLEVVGPAVRRALEATGARFLAIGSEHTQTALDVPLGRGEVAPWTPLTDGYPELVARLDVGIAPLEATKFNASKSALKMIEGSSLGVAMIGSPSAEYLRVNALGVGLIARRPREWEGLLRRLLTDAEWRAEVAGRSRAACALLTYELHAEKWWSAWADAAAIRSKRPAVA